MRTVILAGVAAALLALVAGAHASRTTQFNPDPVFPVGPISDTASHQIPQLESVASKLADRQHTVVNCWSEKDWARLQAWQSAHHAYALVDALGVTWVRSRRIELAPFVCQVLGQLLARSAQQPLFTAAAVNVLAHEAAHASGIDAENRAECRALQTDPQAAHLLGVPEPAAERLQRIYRGTLYPYMAPAYRTPPCAAGLPGIVVPDTLGTESELRGFRTAAAAVARVVPHWKNLGGADSFGPISPCSPTVRRTNERARFGEIFLGPLRESLFVGAGRLQTKHDYQTALVRLKRFDRCNLLAERKLDRENHTPATITYGRIPAAISRLSPNVFAYRDIWTEAGQKWNRDTIFVLNPAQRGWMHLLVRFPVGKLPLSVELLATKALLRTYG